MSIKVPISILTEKQKEKADEITAIQLTGMKFIHPYKIMNNNVYFPFAFASKELKLERPPRNKNIIFKTKFKGELREEQKEVKNEAIKYLNKNGCVLLSMYCGGGKTITAINLACSIKMKTLVVVNKLVLIKQWKESISEFSDATIQKLDGKSLVIDDDADFFIMNAINISKMGHNFFKNIGLVIIDECHMIMAEQISNLMNYIQPRYLIGLSATPYRNDGLDILIDLYFSSNKIIRKLYQAHNVYLVNTNFKPEMNISQSTGKVDFNTVLNSLSDSMERNNIIIDIVKKHTDRNFLILVKRLNQGEYLYNKLLEENQYVDTLLGKKQTFDKKARILIGTSSKIGTGFDHKIMDALILGAPVKDYFIQFLGRVFRKKDIKPIIFDLLDENPILFKHYNIRKEIYKEHGGKIYIYPTN